MKIFSKEETFSEDTIYNFINNQLENKIGIEDLKTIMDAIRTVAKLQGIDLDKIEYHGNGQSYMVFSLGSCAIKIGPEVKIANNPFQALPFHEETLNNSKQKMYLCQKCNTSNISIDDAQTMYNIIRDSGGIWIDPKESNLGIRESKLDTSSFEENINLYNLEKDFDAYKGDVFITDFEDVVFLTPKIIEENMDQSKRWINLPYGNLEGGVLGNRIFITEADSLDINEIYEKGFIMRNTTLLRFEERYQLQKGNKKLANKYRNRRKELINLDKQARYKMRHNRYSARDIGIKIMQSTSLTRIRSIIDLIRQGSRNNKKVINHKSGRDDI